MTFTQLRIFDALVHEGSFTAAAESLGMTQPAISHAISILEQELGLTLVQRDRGGLRLTEPGKKIYGHVREILTQTDCLIQTAVEFAGSERGRLRIGLITSVATRLAPVLLAGFRKHHPQVEVVLFEGTDPEVAEWLRSSAVDIGLLALRLPEFTSHIIESDRVLVALPRNHPLAKNKTISVQAMAQQPFVMSKAGCEPLIQRIYRQEGLTPNVRYEARDVSTVLGMVREGLGVSIVPELALPQKVSGIRLIPLRPVVRREIVAATRGEQSTSPAAKAFLARALRWRKQKGGR
jgi:DNA-binding transcriptional LysR family regulator